MRILGTRDPRDLRSWFDSYGILTQNTGDAGDPNNTFFYYIFAFLQGGDIASLRQEIASMLLNIQTAPGLWIRHPDDGTPWHADYKEFSRDQELSLCLMLKLYGFDYELQKTYQRIVDRGGLFQNKDFTLPLSNWWAFFYRLLGKKTWKTGAGDFFLYLEARWRVYKSWKDINDFGDDKNLVLQFLACELFGHTDWSKKAMNHYRMHRADWILGVPTEHQGSNGAQYAFDRYYETAVTGSPPLAKFAVPTLSKYFSR